MSNLKIAYPDIPWRAVARKQSVTFDEDFKAGNAVAGVRHAYASATAGASGALNMQFDLGSGVTSAIDYLIIARADKLIAQGSTSVILSSATTGIDGTYTARYTNASFASSTLLGPNAHDFLATGLGLSAYRTWRFELSGGASTTRTFSKVYCGNAFDFNHDCDFSFDRSPRALIEEYSDSGAKFALRVDEPFYTFSLRWTRVDNATLKTWLNTIVANKERHRFFLYTTAQHQILDNQRCVHVRLTEQSHQRIKFDRNEVTATFQEVPG